jgi:hypothetical protein
MLLSAVIGVAAAVGLAVKMFWYRLIGRSRAGGGGRSFLGQVARRAGGHLAGLDQLPPLPEAPGA